MEVAGNEGGIYKIGDGATITVDSALKVIAGSSNSDAAYVASPDDNTYAKPYVKIVPAYTITFASNGGSACDPIVVEAGSEVTSLPTSTLANHTFGGWYTSEDLSGTAVESVKPTANMTLYAKWTVRQYTITFNTDGGTKIEDIVGASGMAVTAPANPAKTGYTFAGWDKEIPTTMPAENMTITATWTANSYDAVFDADGGAWADGETAKTVPTAFGSVIVAPADPTKTGYIFAGWTPAVGNMDSVDGKAFTATWTINQYTVTFKVDGETVEAYTQTVNHGGDADMTKTIPHKVGYDDKSPIWSIDGVNAADGKNITADTEFIAVYFQNAPGTYEDTTDSSGNAAAVEIETPIQDLMDAVPLTQEELRQVALGEDVKFWMVSVDDSSAISAEDKTLVDNARSGDIVGMYLDIDLFKQIGANSPVQVTTLNEKIAVTLDVPASLINSNTNKTRTYYVIRVHNGAATVIKPTFDAANRTLTFKTDRFSTYAITYRDTSKPAAVTPATGDNSHILMFTGMAVTSLLCAAMLIVFFPRKKGKYER